MRQELALFGVIALLLALWLLAQHPRVHQAGRELVQRWGPRLVAWLNPPAEVDQLAVDLANTMRRERLRADVRRLERILATDESMSATRQLGNRLAYDWLVREFDRVTSDLPSMFFTNEVVASTSLFDSSGGTRNSARGPSVQHAPKVEILEIGWRR